MDSYKYLSRIYDELMGDVDYDAWANYIDRFIKENNPSAASVIEGGCGTGMISVRLAEKGYKLISTDISEEMLEEASENARDYGVSINFAEQDMRFLSCTGKKDAVIACCDAVNYLTTDDDALAFFKRAYDVLKDNGVLLFDISSYYKLKNIIGDNFFYEDNDDVTYLWQNKYDENTNCVNMDLSFFMPEDDNMYRRCDECHVQRAYKADELLILLKKAGFSDIKAYSFLSKESVKNDDERIQFCAYKERKNNG